MLEALLCLNGKINEALAMPSVDWLCCHVNLIMVNKNVTFLLNACTKYMVM